MFQSATIVDQSATTHGEHCVVLTASSTNATTAVAALQALQFVLPVAVIAGEHAAAAPQQAQSSASSASPLGFPQRTLSIITVIIFMILQVFPECLAVMRGIVQMMWRLYVLQLEAFPVITKSFTTGVIGALGDTLAQYLEHCGRQHWDPNNSRIRQGLPRERFVLQMRRLTMSAVDGIFFTGPFLHYAYDLLETSLPTTSDSSSTLNAVLQLLMDDFVLDSLLVAWAIVSSGVLEGYSLRKEVLPQLKQEFIPAVTAGFATNLLVSPLEFICFRYLPLQLRVLFINFVDVAWDSVVSYMAHRNRHRENDSDPVLNQQHMKAH